MNQTAGAGDTVRVRLKITGRVQGVFFRASAAEEAVRLAIRGWVRNRSDGSVELAAEGTPKAVDALITWCRHGPPGARVSDVRIEPDSCEDEFRDFRIV